MRVALLASNACSGDAIGNQLACKVRFFAERRWEVRVYLSTTRQLHPAVIPYVCRVAGSPWRNAAERAYLRRCDLVVAEYGVHYELLHLLPALAGGRPRIIFDYYGVTPRRLWSAADRHRLEEAENSRRLVWCADVALIHSQFTADELRAATGFPADRLKQLPCCVDLECFSPGPAPIDVRQIYHLEDARVLLFVGRLAANKRVPLLVEALAHLHATSPAIHAVVVGDDRDIYAEEAKACRRLAKQLGLADRLHITGQVDERTLLSWYRSADALVIPSLHEGFCMPVIESMACGLPVVAARAAALPETLGDAGLSFEPDNPDDLARKVRFVLDSRAPGQATPPTSLRIAMVAPRFGNDFVGGAETSLRTIAKTLRGAGHSVQVFTTCNRHDSAWANHYAPGSEILDGIPVHRFPIDAFDRERHLAALDAIRHGNGNVSAAVQSAYLEHSLNSAGLVAALATQETGFDAIIVGPYLFGLTWNVAQRFGKRVLLLPCFHDEPLARMRTLLRAYDDVGGILYHSPEEQTFAEATLGLNHPHARVIGTFLPLPEATPPASAADHEPYVVYCGRYSVEKGVDRLLEYAERYAADHPDRWRFVFIGEGGLRLPRAAWLKDLGYVDDESKRATIANAQALIQLSSNESLSLVALEAWAAGVPVIGHRDCAVLRGQVQRSAGGETIAGYAEFACALDSLWREPARWREMGASGQRYVRQQYATQSSFASRLTTALAAIRTPVAEQMRRKGYARAREFDFATWAERFAAAIATVLSESAATETGNVALEVRPLVERKLVSTQNPLILVPVRVTNSGATVAAAKGPARLAIGYRMTSASGQTDRIAPLQAPLPCLLTPGRSQVAAVPVAVPHEPGSYRVGFFAHRPGQSDHHPAVDSLPALDLMVTADAVLAPVTDFSAMFAAGVQSALAEANAQKTLPVGYTDVTQGLFASWKRLVKRKLLHNFRREYVDVLSRQQSAFNEKIVTAICQLADGLAAANPDTAKTTHADELLRLRIRFRRSRRELQRLKRTCSHLAQRLATVEQLLRSYAQGKEVSP